MPTVDERTSFTSAARDTGAADAGVAESPRIGFVIPVYTTKFIKPVIRYLIENTDRSDAVFCVVNDGQPKVGKYLSKTRFPRNVIALDLEDNRCFAGANNAGWKQLIDEYPSLEFLGTINDDTRPHPGWLGPLVNALENYPRTGLAAPLEERREGLLRRRRTYAYVRLNNAYRSMIDTGETLTEDTFVSAACGFCFLARREALEEVGFFDETFRNSGDDVDLSIRLITSGWRIVVCKDSVVYHIGGQSRFRRGTGTRIKEGKQLKADKWGFDLTCYTRL
jgi:GT2 family glycosyltransferase